MANEQGGIYLWVVWMEIAVSQPYLAGRSRLGLEAAEAIGPDYIRDLDGELSASMICIAASAHAIDAFCGSVSGYVEFPAGLRATWRQNRTKRPAQILETLKLAFVVGRHSRNWSKQLRWLFDLRDFAVHHRTEIREMEWHATKRTKVSREHSLYSLENANEAVKLALEIMKTCVASPRISQKQIIDWMPDARHFVEVVERFRMGPSRYAV